MLLVPVLGACSSTQYTPIKSARVSSTSDGFVRDGVKYPDTFSGLEEAVKENSRARAEAQKGGKLFTGGMICGGVGLGFEVLGVVLTATGSKQDEETGDVTYTNAMPIGLAMLLSGIALNVAALVLVNNSTAHAVDAMNIYNDDVELKRAAPPPSALGPRIDALPSETPPATGTPPASEAPAP